MTTPAARLVVRRVRISALREDPNNARRHSKRNLVAGSGTLEAARDILGWDKLDVSYVPDDWTLEYARAYAIADNRTGELAEWDADNLDAQLLDLELNGWDVTRLGFDATGRDDDEVVQDEVPDLPKRPKSKLGDVWTLGRHTLLVGDCTLDGSLARLMGGAKADAVFTDPPYNVAYTGGTKDALTITNDAMSPEDFRAFLLAAFTQMLAVAKPGAAIYVCYASLGTTDFHGAFVDAGWLLKQVLVWVKDSFVLGRQDYHWQHEPIMYGWKPGGSHKWRADRKQSTVLDDEVDLALLSPAELVALLEAVRRGTDVIREDRPRRSADHPTMKPVPLVARLVCNSTRAGDVVLDPFAGSGSTLIACEQTGRINYSSELDPKFADVIVKRWETLTGQKAERHRGEG